MRRPPCVVCVPALNEREVVPRLLAALAAQEPVQSPLRVVLLANNCTDDTAGVARAIAATEPRLALRIREVTLPCASANVGVARGLAMDEGARWLEEEGCPDGILVSTDADASPPPHWIDATLCALQWGADVVGGEIRIAARPGAAIPSWLSKSRTMVAEYWSVVRALAHCIDPLPHDPPPRHGDHTGASLALRVSLYAASGGIPPLASGEDHALVDAVERLGGRLRHPPTVWTAVDPREDGRAMNGMAAEMRRWREHVDAQRALQLPGAAHWLTRFQRRRALREAYWHRFPPTGIFNLSEGRCVVIASASVNDIAFVARAEAELPPLPSGCRDIEIAIDEIRRATHAASVS